MREVRHLGTRARLLASDRAREWPLTRIEREARRLDVEVHDANRCALHEALREEYGVDGALEASRHVSEQRFDRERARPLRGEEREGELERGVGRRDLCASTVPEALRRRICRGGDGLELGRGAERKDALRLEAASDLRARAADQGLTKRAAAQEIQVLLARDDVAARKVLDGALGLAREVRIAEEREHRLGEEIEIVPPEVFDESAEVDGRVVTREVVVEDVLELGLLEAFELVERALPRRRAKQCDAP